MTGFLAIYKSVLNPCLDGNVHIYAKAKELEKKAFTINSRNMNQEIGIRVTFTLEINLSKYIFYQKLTIFYEILCTFSTPVRMGICIGKLQLKN